MGTEISNFHFFVALLHFHRVVEVVGDLQSSRGPTSLLKAESSAANFSGQVPMRF